jgi:chemotaxis protein histidine kinase CheA
VVDWRGFGTEQWGGAGIPVADTPQPKADETPLPGAPTPKAPPEPAPSTGGSASESVSAAAAVEEEPAPAEATPRALVSEAEASFLRERIEQHERSIDRLEQLVARAQELQLAEQRAHEGTRRQLSEAQERVVRLLEAPRPEPGAPVAPSTASTAAGAEPAAPVEPPPARPETGSAEAVTRDVRRGLVRLSRWLRG